MEKRSNATSDRREQAIKIFFIDSCVSVYVLTQKVLEYRQLYFLFQIVVAASCIHTHTYTHTQMYEEIFYPLLKYIYMHMYLKNV